MATKGHTRSRSSIDRVIDLLADLEETQITHLLDDLNHTTSSNVPVTDAIALFDRHVNKPSRQRSVRSPEPLRTLQAELERRHSKRMSAAPSRFRPAAGPAATSSVSSTQPRASLDHISVSPARARSPPPPAVSELPTIELPSFELPPMDFFDRPSSPLRAPSLRLSSPEPVSIDGEDDDDEDEQDHLDSRATSISRSPSPSRLPPSSSATFRPRSYKRISRPIFLSPTATAELHLLLLAFFNEATPVPPVSPTTIHTPAAVSPTTTSFTGIHPTTTRSIPSTVATTTATPSPTTPLFSGFSHSPIFRSHFFDDDEDDMEPTTPGLEDLLEPSPVRASSFSAMGGLGPNGGGNGGGGGLGVGGGLGGGLGLRKGSAGGRSLKTMPSISSMFDLMKP